MAYQSDLLRLLDERGHLHQITNPAALDALAAREVVTGYVGYDPTAPSLHVGNLATIMLLRRLQQAGHRPIVLMGGGTAKVGDPSFRDEVRSLLAAETIATNVAAIRRIFGRILRFDDSATGATMVDNADWLDRLEYLPFLREVGQHFTISRMLSFESVKQRLEREQSLTFLEFNYMIMQAFDFRELARSRGCRLQLGGSDQWGNIVNGVELGRRMDGAELFGVTCPLVTTADGAKMGKTLLGAVWLHEDQLSHYDFWQFWRNTDDRDVGRFLRLFTDLPLDEIAQLEALSGAEINAAKVILANEATALCRGKPAADSAAESARRTFEEGAGGEALPRLNATGPLTVVDALVGLGLVASKGEARRLIKGGGARVAGERVADEAQLIGPATEPVRVSAGKKQHGLVLFD